MQIKEDMTKEDLLTSRAAVDEAVFPLSILKFVAEVFGGAMDHTMEDSECIANITHEREINFDRI